MLCCRATVASVDLTLVGGAAQLPGELGALGEAGGAERVALGDQAAGGVDDPAAAVGGVVVVDELAALALAAQAERLVGQQLVGGEAVVQLDDVDVVGADAGLLVDRAARPAASCRAPTSAIADPDSKVARQVGDHRLADDLDRLRRRGRARSTNSSLARIAAPEPSEVGEHCSLVSGS